MLAEDDGDALDTVQWWLTTTRFDGFVGAPAGPPEWPFPGGELRQPGKLVDAVEVLRTEWGHLPRATRAPAKQQAPVRKSKRR